MNYKKILISIGSLALIIATITACGKSETENETTVTEQTNPPPYTTVFDGKTLNAQKLSPDDKNYTVGIYDDNGRGIGLEYYKDGKLSYYYISSDFDESGNSHVQTYYNADGKLIATIDDDGFHDAKGNIISEYEMDQLIPS